MKQIKLTKGLFALVDDADYDYLNQWKWHASFDGRGKWYARRRAVIGGKRRRVGMHQEVMQRKSADPVATFILMANGFVVDHINENSLDNRRINLQLLTNHQNMLKCPRWKRRKA